ERRRGNSRAGHPSRAAPKKQNLIRSAFRRKDQVGLSDLADVLSRRAFVALHDVELDAVALGETLESGSLDRRAVHEEVVAPILRRDEAEALGVIEPLHFSCVAHCRCLSFFLFWSQKDKKGPLLYRGPFRNFWLGYRGVTH